MMLSFARKGRGAQPPFPHLVGRTGASRIFGTDKRGIRRLEASGVLRPALVDVHGHRWFDIATVTRLALRRRRTPLRQARSPNTPNLKGPCTGEETRAINEAFAQGMPHWEICSRFDKTNEVIRYMFEQFRTPSGANVILPAFERRKRLTKASPSNPMAARATARNTHPKWHDKFRGGKWDKDE